MRVTTIDVTSFAEFVGNVRRRISAGCEHEKCPNRALYLCDWKIGEGKGLCDALCCAEHVEHPTGRKDLCCAHAAEWEKRRQQIPLNLVPLERHRLAALTAGSST